jgi:hypothetical protein
VLSQYNPNGIASHSPRLSYSATLGRRVAMGSNPNGVAPLAGRMVSSETWRRSVTASVVRNPVGVAANDRLRVSTPKITQGSRVQQPWAERCNPLRVEDPTAVGGFRSEEFQNECSTD